MAVLFVDLREFTRLSEGMTPEEVSAFVTEFRRQVSQATAATGGIIDKYLGDAAMILFRGDGDANQAAADCLACAEALHVAICTWSEARQQAGLLPIRAGIGAHIG